MKNDFDKKIKNLMEDANLSDTGFSLDKGDVWNKIEAKNKTKIIPFGKWISHTAAVIIGILICLPFLFHSKKEAAQIVTVTKTAAAPAQIIRDTIFLQNNTNGVALRAANTRPQKHVMQPAKAGTVSTSQPIAKEEDKPKQPENIAEAQTLITSASSVASKPKVMYLLDMDNENAATPAKRKEGYSIFKIININTDPRDKSESLTMFVGNQLLKTKN